MTTELVKAQNGASFEQMKEQANLLVKSGFLPSAIKTPEQALTIMLTGKELSLGMMESLRSINVVQGKPCMSAQLLLGLCYRTKEVEQAFFEKQSPSEVVFVLKRRGEPAYKAVWTMDRAKALGLAGKDNWNKQPQTMLQWRAISEACRLKFPDAICGLYTPEEIADGVDVAENPQTGEIIIKEIQEIPNEIPQEPQSPKEENATTHEDDIPDDQLGNWRMPLGKYKGKRLIEIISEITASGKNKGLEYLEWYAENGLNPKWVNVISRFLKILKESK